MSPQTKTRFDRSVIAEIKETGSCQMRCIKVEAKDGLYLTSDYIITHNTTILTTLAASLAMEGYQVCCCAMTGKATGVLRSKVFRTLEELGGLGFKDNLNVNTLTKITKSSVLGITENGETLYTNEWLNPDAAPYDLIIADETSMISQLYVEWMRRTKALVVFAGDYCQLPEVSTAEVKKEIYAFKRDLKYDDIKFQSGYGLKLLKDYSHINLTEVLRSTGDITNFCNDLRDFSMTKIDYKDLFQRWAKKSPVIDYSTTAKDIEFGGDWQILAYKNDTCRQINNQLCIGGEYPALEDKIVLFDNINPLGLYNGDVLYFHQLLAKGAIGNTGQKQKVFICIKWQGKMPSKDSKNPIEVNFFRTYVNFKQAMNISQARRLESLESLIRASGRADKVADEYIKFVNDCRNEYPNSGECFAHIIEEFQNSDWELSQYLMQSVETLPRLYMVSADFGYCLTSYRAQGSEFEKVCYIAERFDKNLIYTGCSRAKEKLKIIDLM